MAKFIIEPHFRLQEWIAEEKGFFQGEGLDYEFRELIRSSGGKHHDKGDKVGAYQSFEAGRQANVSCACHWTVNVAASKGHGKLYADVYSVSPISRAATTRRFRRSSPICRSTRSICPTKRACCSRGSRTSSRARRRRCRCSAGPITSPSSSASAR